MQAGVKPPQDTSLCNLKTSWRNTCLLQNALDRLAIFRPAPWWSTIVVQGLRTVSKQNDLKEPVHGVNGIQELIILSPENNSLKQLLIHVLDWYSRMFVSQRKFGSNVRCFLVWNLISQNAKRILELRSLQRWNPAKLYEKKAPKKKKGETLNTPPIEDCPAKALSGRDSARRQGKQVLERAWW